ncbi:hypothetical protein [Litchfieldia alkalitelluris]|uniref:hypothetical protein n=1 Tax=Litchfieldia alkalitelluris TaxID=304268 RepID=UPI000998B42D|nr:hypothetical protein [Litchfieldia alkalitelluris]
MDDSLLGLLNENSQLMTLIIGIVAIVVIVSILRSVVRMVMPIVIVGLVMVVFLGHSPNDVLNKGKEFASFGTDIIQDIIPFLKQKDDPFFDGEAEKGTSDSPSEFNPFSKDELEKFIDEYQDNNDTETFDSQKDEVDVNKL